MRLLILTLLLVVTSMNEGRGAQLNRISRTQTATSVLIYTYFDELPVYRQRFNDRRLDLTFFDTIAEERLQLPEADDILIKTLVVREQGKTILSFFFRYIPQDLAINTDQSETLIVDLIPGNRFTANYKELLASLGQVSLVPENRKTKASPLSFSPYGDDWLSFFKKIDNEPSLIPLPKSYFLPFPLTSLAAAVDSGNYDESLAVIQGLDQTDWFESLRFIQNRLTSIQKVEERKYYAIAHADILFRLGSVGPASDQFKLLQEAYKDDIAGDLAIYSRAVIKALNHDFYKAQIELRALLERLPEHHPLLPYVRLALAETALATNQYKQMKEQLDTIEEISSPLSSRVQLRTADLALATGRSSDAFTIYSNLYGSPAMTGQPYSLSGYCSILFSRQIYDESFKCYKELASLLNDKEQLAQAHYRAALSEMLAGEAGVNTADRFNQIIERFPGTAAALRAEMKQADICFLQGGDCADNLQPWYRSIADQATSRDISQEASFKEALVYHLDGDNSISIRLLSEMLRTFLSGDTRDHAQALLIQIIPGEIERLLAEGQDVEAIALAQQNRFFFENGWLDNALLLRVGLAFENLALYPEALQLFLYLKKSPNSDDDETIHLASARVAHALGDYRLVEDLAAEYFYRYPEGKYQLDILFYQLDCRYGVGHIDEALKLLPTPLPQRDDFRLLTASLYFYNNDYARTADLLLPLYRTNGTGFSEDHLYMLAESLFNLQSFSECLALFVKLAATEGYGQSARFRLRQLNDSKGEEAAIYIPADGRDEGEEQDRWQRFAALDLRYKDMLSLLHN